MVVKVNEYIGIVYKYIRAGCYNSSRIAIDSRCSSQVEFKDTLDTY